MAYYVDGKEQYTESGNINIGDTIITPEGYKQVDNIEQGDYSKNFIDFTVDEDNNYYAGNDATNLILAHNSATLYFPIWHLEVEDLLVLKNNKGTEETRIRTLDYGIQMNKLMYERLLSGGHITLFSPHDVPDLYDAFYTDQNKFRELYEMYERKTSIRKTKVSAIELFSTFIQERKDTGRMYLMNVDHANEHGSFKPDLAPIKMSNLCSEIDLPTKPLNDFNDEEGEIALCSLSAINWGAFKKPEDMERACNLAVRGLDSLLTYQEYPVKAAQIATENRRPLGIGIINLAYFLAKNGVGYNDQEGLELVDTWAQHWSYYLIKASNDLAKEYGACPLNNETKYSDGVLPIDTYKKEVNEVVKHKNKMDWKGLRKSLKEHGIRNSTLMALMPSECQSLNNIVKLKDGTDVHLSDLIKSYGSIDIDKAHKNTMIGQRFDFFKPVELANSIAYGCYYNGTKELTEIEFDDGSVYRFTENHKLLVSRNGVETWVMVKNLIEHDDVISVNG